MSCSRPIISDIVDEIDAGHIVFTGPIDEYFGFRFGKLPYRSLRFEHKVVDQAQFQPVAVVNYPDPQVPYTRITEYKHLTGQSHAKTSITYEYPSAEGDPYYPIPRPENQALFKKYEALADATPGVTFVGRLATYRYYNMDQVVGQALAAFRRLDDRRKVEAGGQAAARSGPKPRNRLPPINDRARRPRLRWSCECSLLDSCRRSSRRHRGTACSLELRRDRRLSSTRQLPHDANSSSAPSKRLSICSALAGQRRAARSSGPSLATTSAGS